MKNINVFILCGLFFLMVTAGMTQNQNQAKKSILPVKKPTLEGFNEVGEGIDTKTIRGISNFFHIRQIYDAVKDGQQGGLLLDFSQQAALLIGAKVNPKAIYGDAYFGPYPFEANETTYTYKRFRRYAEIDKGRATLPVNYLLAPSLNSENWATEGTITLRVVLYLKTVGVDYYLGTYDTFIRFKIRNGRALKMPTLMEGPMVNMITSNNPDRMVISFKTSIPLKTEVVLGNGNRFADPQPVTKHEIPVTGLEPGKSYTYNIQFEGFQSRSYTFKTAPAPGQGDVSFAYTGDSRSGAGGGMNFFMGVNYNILERNTNLAFNKNADLFIFGGDLVNGYTAKPMDFRTQIHGWKQGLAGFWSSRPVYTCMGNHESLLRVFQHPAHKHTPQLDRWPYETDSAEAVFADELVQPLNGPEVADKRRPTYKENVFSFQYGPVKFISFNNNYWYSGTRGMKWQMAKQYGGCPEGYVMEDQMEWIEKELAEGEKNPTVKYIILFAQEPVFPNGGHVADCMWYDGNNDVRAYVFDGTELKREKYGIIDVRNRLVRMVGNNPKVAAVLGSDEHSYHKMLLDNGVPVGVMETDDKDGSGVICKDGESCSALEDLKYPAWYIVSGGCGAPYYAEEKTPWNTYWKDNPDKYRKERHTSLKGTYYYSSQENVMIFKSFKDGISVTVYNPYGEVVDQIDNLMAVKRDLKIDKVIDKPLN